MGEPLFCAVWVMLNGPPSEAKFNINTTLELNTSSGDDADVLLTCCGMNTYLSRFDS